MGQDIFTYYLVFMFALFRILDDIFMYKCEQVKTE